MCVCNIALLIQIVCNLGTLIISSATRVSLLIMQDCYSKTNYELGMGYQLDLVVYIRARAYENPWEPLRTAKNLREPLGTHENHWEPTRTHENHWELLRTYESLQDALNHCYNTNREPWEPQKLVLNQKKKKKKQQLYLKSCHFTIKAWLLRF